MRRGRAPSREPSGSGGPQWDDPNGSCQGQGFLLTVVTAFTGAVALGEEGVPVL